MKIKNNVVLMLSLAVALAGCGKQQTAVADAAGPSAPPSAAPQAAAVTTPRVAPPVTPASELVEVAIGEGESVPLALAAGQTVGGTLTAPQAGNLIGFDVEVGTYLDTSTGRLKLEVCKDNICRMGDADILTSLDNSMFPVVLTEALTVEAGDTVKFTFTKDGGDVPLAFWTYPIPAGVDMKLVVDGNGEMARLPKLGLRYAK